VSTRTNECIPGVGPTVRSYWDPVHLATFSEGENSVKRISKFSWLLMSFVFNVICMVEYFFNLFVKTDLKNVFFIFLKKRRPSQAVMEDGFLMIGGLPYRTA
jgi:hypothetical protein